MLNLLTKRTPAQVVFIHTAESAVLSAVLTVIVGAFQYLSIHGFDMTGLAAVLGTSFLAQMAMVYKSLQANSNTIQAEIDTEKQASDVAMHVLAGLPPPQAPIIHLDAQQVAGEAMKQLNIPQLLPQLLPQLATLLKNELVSSPVPQRPQSQQMIGALATNPGVEAVRTSTPQFTTMPPPNPASWMNSPQQPGRAG